MEFLEATAGAGAILIKEGEVLLAKPNYGKASGNWILPGGMVDPGENPQECAQREVVEETGLEASITTPVAIRFRPNEQGKANIYWAFRGDLGEEPLTDLKKKLRWPEDELLESAFVPLKEVLESPLVRPMTKMYIRMSENLGEPFEPVTWYGTDCIYRCG